MKLLSTHYHALFAVGLILLLGLHTELDCGFCQGADQKEVRDIELKLKPALAASVVISAFLFVF